LRQFFELAGIADFLPPGVIEILLPAPGVPAGRLDMPIVARGDPNILPRRRNHQGFESLDPVFIRDPVAIGIIIDKSLTAPLATISWSIQIRIDKSRFFRHLEFRCHNTSPEGSLSSQYNHSENFRLCSDGGTNFDITEGLLNLSKSIMNGRTRCVGAGRGSTVGSGPMQGARDLYFFRGCHVF
jgi:hypothetical protein